MSAKVSRQGASVLVCIRYIKVKASVAAVARGSEGREQRWTEDRSHRAWSAAAPAGSHGVF